MKRLFLLLFTFSAQATTDSGQMKEALKVFEKALNQQKKKVNEFDRKLIEISKIQQDQYEKAQEALHQLYNGFIIKEQQKLELQICSKI